MCVFFKIIIEKGAFRLELISKSILVIFSYDFFTFLIITSLLYSHFNLPEPFLNLTVLLTVLTGLSVLFLKENYKIREFNNTLKNYYLLFEGVVFSQIPAALILFPFVNGVRTFEFLIANLFIIYITLLIYRVIFHFYLFNIKKEKNVLIIGSNKDAKLIADVIINKKALKMRIAGFYEDASEEDYVSDGSVKVITSKTNLRELIIKNKIEIIIIAIERRMEGNFLSSMVQSIPQNVKIFKMAELYELATGKYFINRMSINWLFYDYMKKRSYIYNFCKRAFDIIAALIIFIVTLPILLYIGIRVKLTDGGSAIYTQTRIGKNGKPFKMYKLRTMYLNDYIPQKGKIEHTESQDKDERVIPFCKFVRKARFDEIPQMINILKGDMSIVGPRAEWEDLVNIYTNEIPYYVCRQWVKTGWTGWAQINQGHCVLSDDIAEKLQYDLYYLKHRNIIWEIGILVKAVFLALGGRHG